MAICLQALKVFLEDKLILHDLTYIFPSGLTYLIGSNGSGKTTLLHSIAQIQTYQGNVFLNKKMLSSFSHKEVARHFALIRQQSQPKFSLKVLDFVLQGRFPYLNWLGTYQQEDYEYAYKGLETLKINHLSQKVITKLSGGEWQKVLIARALAQNTPIILMDEPAQFLDPKNKQEFYALLVQMSEEGKTIICTTHDLEAIVAGKGNILALKKGTIVLEGRGPFNAQRLFDEVY